MRYRTLTSLLTLVAMLSLVLSACTDESAGEDDAIDVGDDTDMAMDVQVDQPDDTDATDTDMVSGSEITFYLQNIGTDSVWYQTGFDLTGWLTLLDQNGEPMQISTNCECACDQYPNCPVCDIAPPMAQELGAPGGELERTWNGTRYRRVDAPDGQGTCLERVVVPDGTYNARFCWGNSFEGEEFNSFVTGFECDTLDFDLGTTRELRKGVSVETPLDGFDVVLENVTGNPIYIQSANNCTTNPDWLSIGDGMEDFQLFADCGLCACAQGPDCNLPCPDACFPPQVTEILPGESASWTWDGRVELNKSLADNWSCRDRVAPDVTEVSVEVCFGYSYTGTDGSGTVDNPSCQLMNATLGEDDTVVFQPPVPVP